MVELDEQLRHHQGHKIHHLVTMNEPTDIPTSMEPRKDIKYQLLWKQVEVPSLHYRWQK